MPHCRSSDLPGSRGASPGASASGRAPSPCPPPSGPRLGLRAHGWAVRIVPAFGQGASRKALRAELVGGPLDGLLLDIHGGRAEEVDGGVALSTELSRWPGGRALYDLRPGEPRTPGPGVICRFYCSGDTP